MARQPLNGALCQIQLLVFVSHGCLQAPVSLLVLCHLVHGLLVCLCQNLRKRTTCRQALLHRQKLDQLTTVVSPAAFCAHLPAPF